jgi:hypothetical protein
VASATLSLTDNTVDGQLVILVFTSAMLRVSGVWLLRALLLALPTLEPLMPLNSFGRNGSLDLLTLPIGTTLHCLHSFGT